MLERAQPAPRTHAAGTTVDPVMLEVFNNLFMNIAEQMGLQLQNTAYSVNIKERLDFSCALFDAAGQPDRQRAAHAGAPGLDGREHQDRDRAQRRRMQPGDVYVLNDPYHGGTHLPDVTVVTPVYLDDAGADAAVLRRLSAATMPTSAASRRARCRRSRTRIDEEGVQIDNVKLVERGVLREAEMLALLPSGAYPARNPQQNLADLKAQIAANEKGVQELRKMVAQFGLDVVQAYMRHVQDNAEESVRRVITR